MGLSFRGLTQNAIRSWIYRRYWFQQLIAKLTNTVHSRLEEIDCKLEEKRISEIVALNFPDYRAIANAVEFELI